MSTDQQPIHCTPQSAKFRSHGGIGPRQTETHPHTNQAGAHTELERFFFGLALFESTFPVLLAAHQVLYILSLLPAAGTARARIPSSTRSVETMG